MSSGNLPFFAIRDSGASEAAINIIRLAQKVQGELTAMFNGQRAEFLASSDEVVEFDGRYQPDPDELLSISPFKVPGDVLTAVANPISQDPLPFDEAALASIRGIFTGVWTKREKWLALQVFDRKKLISTSAFNLIHSGETFVKLTEPGIVVDPRLSAVVEDEKLLFHSFSQARRLFDLTSYFHEATDQDLEVIATHPRIHVVDPEQFVINADQWTRKKIALISESKVLDLYSARHISRVAESYGVKVKIVRIDGNERIEIPVPKKEMKTLLRVLDEDYFTSSLSQRGFVTNSKRPVIRS